MRPHVHLRGEIRRPLHRHERCLVYGLLGWSMEVAFTGVTRALRPSTRDSRLCGHTSLWMLPLYGSLAYVYEPLHERLRTRPRWQRTAAYASGMIAGEFVTGAGLRRVTGVCPWDYTGASPLVIDGVTRLDYAPLWALVGLALERLHDELVTAPVVRVHDHG